MQQVQEITNLIAIRQYVANATTFPHIDKETVSELTGMLLLLDQKIVGLLKSTHFKNYIEFEKSKQAKTQASLISNEAFIHARQHK
jgi:hypothetical protein